MIQYCSNCGKVACVCSGARAEEWRPNTAKTLSEAGVTRIVMPREKPICPKCAAAKGRLRVLLARDPDEIETREWMSLETRHEYALREVAHWRFAAMELLAMLEGGE
jgi:hypothetical protein